MQAWPTKTSQEELISNSSISENDSATCKKYLTTQCIISFLIGFIICGIPLAVMSASYAQKSSSSNSVNLPSQCTSYITNLDSIRLTTFTSCTGYSASTRLATISASYGSCGASYPAWYNGTFPSTSGSSISGTVCAQNGTLSSTVGATSAGTQCASYSANLCPPSYSVSSVLATNCNGYYVFYFIPLICACCSSIYPRYCTI
ncbi:unnamed protein product [Rotaria sp. Silwood1]|nr:unnamed protein product [Rotaria sp. Silwood1]